MYNYLTNDSNVNKKAKDTKKCVIKWEIKFKSFKTYLENNKTILTIWQRFRNDTHNSFTEKVNKIALPANDDKRIQTSDQVISYTCGTDSGKVCKSELMKHAKIKIGYND